MDNRENYSASEVQYFLDRYEDLRKAAEVFERDFYKPGISKEEMTKSAIGLYKNLKFFEEEVPQNVRDTSSVKGLVGRINLAIPSKVRNSS